MFDFQYWTNEFKKNPGYNDANSYGVSIHQSQDAKWQIIGVHHLLGHENVGKNNVFFEVLDEEGLRIRDEVRIHWIWEGMRPDQQPYDVVVDKPDNEPGGNLALGRHQKVTCWIVDLNGNTLSGRVSNLHTGHTDEKAGNSWGHHSFYVCFRKVNGDAVIPDPGLPDILGDVVITANKEFLDTLPVIDGNVSFSIILNKTSKT